MLRLMTKAAFCTSKLAGHTGHLIHLLRAKHCVSTAQAAFNLGKSAMPSALSNGTATSGWQTTSKVVQPPEPSPSPGLVNSSDGKTTVVVVATESPAVGMPVC